MGFIEAEGIVLRKYNLSDADRIVVVLTEKRGLVRGVAHGAKRLKSKFSGSLEFFSRINLSYFEKEDRELVSIRHTDLLESAFGQLSNPQFFEAFAEIADLLIRFTPPNERSERLFNMTKHCLKAAIEDPEGVESIRVYFEIWLLKLGGFLPTWQSCRECLRNLEPSENAALHLDFQIVCADCGGGLGPVDKGVRNLFNFAQKTSPQKFVAAATDMEDHLRSLKEILSRLTDAVLERAPASGLETGNAL
ncbi:MAG: DNA repair protein RecO [Acidobacteriota bacterium]|nr:DNA repair protein RecO [Acidobacteriota bacterium]